MQELNNEVELFVLPGLLIKLAFKLCNHCGYPGIIYNDKEMKI
jgi:hypothetical protein